MADAVLALNPGSSSLKFAVSISSICSFDTESTCFEERDLPIGAPGSRVAVHGILAGEHAMIGPRKPEKIA